MIRHKTQQSKKKFGTKRCNPEQEVYNTLSGKVERDDNTVKSPTPNGVIWTTPSLVYEYGT